MTNTTGGVVVTPSARAYGRWVKQGLPTVGLLSLFMLWRSFKNFDSTGGRATAVITVVVVVGLGGLAMLSYIKGARVTVTQTEVDATGFFWRHRRFARTDVSVAVEVAGLDQATAMRPATPMLVLLDHGGKRLLRLSGALWDTADLDTLARAIGAPIDPVGVVSATQLQARHPHAVLPTEVHPIRYGLLIALGVVVIVVVAVVIAMA